MNLLFLANRKKTQLLLNKFPGSVGALSLDKVDMNDASPLIKVRRSSDNTEKLIVTKNNSLDIDTLLEFVGNGDGFVTVWFDKSNLKDHLYQSAASSQPQIVSAGNLITQGGRPALKFDGINDYMYTNKANLNNANGAVYIISKADDSGRYGIASGYIDGNTIGIYGQYFSGDATLAGNASQSSHHGSRQLLLIRKLGANSYSFLVNNQDDSGGINGGYRIGANRTIGCAWIGSASLYFKGTISEVIAYPTGDNYPDITSDINSRHEVY